MRPARRLRLLSLCAVWLCLTAARSYAGPQSVAAPASQDWQATARERVRTEDLPGALAAVDARLGDAPDDLEARGWRARILGWQGRWQESEREYRRVLDRAPQDVDILVGLGRTLRALDRPVEARAAFRSALAVDPKNAEARQGLTSLPSVLRHQLAANADADALNYTPQDAQAYAATVRSDWTRRWTSSVGMRVDHRAGLSAARWSGAVTAKLPSRSALTVGASIGRDNGIVSKGEVFAEFGRGFTFARDGVIRGVEVSVQPRRLWFDAADVVTITPGTVIYLPHEWTLSVAITAARSRFPDVGAEWRPSGIARMAFPLSERVIAHVFGAAGTENFALVDQIGRFSARTVGGGARFRFANGRDLTGYVAFQARTQGRTQTSVGFGHAIRF